MSLFGYDPLLVALLMVLVLMNLVAFLSMLSDKRSAQKVGAERLSEGKIFFLAICFGSLGVYVGMLGLHHKTRQWHFLIGIPLLLVQNICTLYVLYLLVVAASR